MIGKSTSSGCEGNEKKKKKTTDQACLQAHRERQEGALRSEAFRSYDLSNIGLNPALVGQRTFLGCEGYVSTRSIAIKSQGTYRGGAKR